MRQLIFQIKSLALNLKYSHAIEIVKKLVQTYDIVLEIEEQTDVVLKNLATPKKIYKI